jgi:serine protease
MKKATIALLSILTAASAFAASEPGRYIVGTRGPAPRTFEEIRPHTRDAEPQRFSRNFHRFSALDGFVADLTPEEARALKGDRRVLYVERDRPIWAMGIARVPTVEAAREARRERLNEERSATAPSPSRPQTTPYGISMVNAPAVWAKAQGAGIKVGVIDSGIDLKHADLVRAYKGGYDFVDNDNLPQDGNGHGTHVAGTIAAENNAFGVVGIAPDISLYALRVLRDDGSGSVSAEVRAVDWAIANNLHVINLSLGADEESLSERAAFQRAFDAGLIAVAAAGNDGGTRLSYPAAYPTTLAVAAINSGRSAASFSNQGTGMSIAAPGVGVLSAIPTGTGSSSDVTVQGSTTFFDGYAMDGSPRRVITGKLVFSGLGRTGEFPSGVRDNIALIQRGEISFADKAKNAKNAGATAVLIFNNVEGSFLGTLIGENQQPFDFPLTLSISDLDGAALKKLEGTTVTAASRIDDYGSKQGTSMATPHVAGVAALVWSMVPGASANEIRNALLLTATDLGPSGVDSIYGYGLVDAFAAARRLRPADFPLESPRRRAIRP